MVFLRWIENRHILWTALSLVAIGLIVPGGFGIKPPQWLNDRQPQDVASVPASDLDADDLSTSAVTRRETLDVEDGLRPAQQALAPALSKPDQAKPDQTSVVIVPSKFARHIPAKHFEMTGDAQKQSFINLVLPLILAANDELLQRREAVQAAVQAHDRDKLDQWAVLYRIEAEKLDDTELAERLLRRVDTIPVALALARPRLSQDGAHHDLPGKAMPCLANGHGPNQPACGPWRPAMIGPWCEVSAACWNRYGLICII